VRFATYNLWGLAPPLEARLARAARQLAVVAADVVAVQEVRPLPGGGRTTAHALGDRLGMRVIYAPAVSDAGHEEEGLALLVRGEVGERRVSRLPEPGVDAPRILLSARVSVLDGELWCHTTHLAWPLDAGAVREQQVVAVDDQVRARGDDVVHVLGGDFNATPECDEIRFLRGEHTLAGRRTYYQDAWLRIHAGDPGHTWCAQGPEGRSQRTVDVDRRLDYVFVSPRRKDGTGTIRNCRLTLDERDQRGDACSDHLAVVADVQLRPGR
jgi:endonuclease/exonuclease/phosphatase family metal-dependent hydrolase